MLFFCWKHTHIISCKKKKTKVESEYLLKETKRSRPFIIYFPREDKLTFTFQFFLHEVLFNVYLVGNLLWSLVKIFAENVARGNSVQIGPNFPAKSLSIYNNFFVTSYLLIKENLNKQINALWYLKLVAFWVKHNRTELFINL